MEDYSGAFDARYADAEVLYLSTPSRLVAAIHLGGIAVECQLKSILLDYHKISDWDQPGNRSGDPKYHQPIPRPGHSFTQVLKCMRDLHQRAKADPDFLTHLNTLFSPVGNTSVDFISIRYHNYALAGTTSTQWKRSLDYVKGWLTKQAKLL